MSRLILELSSKTVQELEELSKRLALPPEKFVRIGIEMMLANPDETLKKAADYVFDKNQKLYEQMGDESQRAGHAVMEMFLVLNDYELNCSREEQLRVINKVASGDMGKEELENWLSSVIKEKDT